MLGFGLPKGLAVTAKNFLQSYVVPERMTTVQYPEQKVPLHENFRSFPFLVYDESPDAPRCTACKICEKECPPQCIYIVEDRDEKGKALRRPKVFDIDYSVCMGCQICVELCPFESIKMDQVYELSTTDRFEGLLVRKEQLLKTADYYEKIHPTEAKPVNEKIRAQIEKKKKADAAKAAAAAAKPAAPAAPAS